MTQPPRIEAGTTRLFSVQYSANPMTAPTFSVAVGSAVVVVFSVSATSAGTAFAFQRVFTMPVGSDGIYAYRWTAAFSSSVVGSFTDTVAGLIQVSATRPWTTS